MEAHETIIVGCGIAGIACARRLARAGREFLVLTEDVGGRILSSPGGLHNYGAQFVLDDFEEVREVLTFTRRVPRRGIEFHRNGETYSPMRMLRHPIEVLRLLRLLRSFRARYAGFRSAARALGQQRAMRADDQLMRLYRMSAEDLLAQERIEHVGRRFLGAAVYSCTFMPLSEVSAFDFLRVSLGFLVPTSEFRFDRDAAVAPFAERIVQERVTATHERRVEGASGRTYDARHLVVATPPTVARDLLGLEIKPPARVTVRHVCGDPHPRYANGTWGAFQSDSDVVALYRYADGTYLVASMAADLELDTYFAEHELLFEKTWDPAFNMAGGDLVEQDLGDGIFCISDINVIGLEESYISGVWAAEQILARV